MMTRRNLFRSFTACIVASSMEVMGVRHVAELDEMAVLDYSFSKQMGLMVSNFEKSIVDIWEERDRDAYYKSSTPFIS